MKKIRISFETIAERKKFENALEFVNISYVINEELNEIEVEKSGMENNPSLKFEISNSFTVISFRLTN